jgi:hypothetical protein
MHNRLEGLQILGGVTFTNYYGISVDFTSFHSGAQWPLTNIYGPCTNEEKPIFIDRFQQIEMQNDVERLILRYFNLIR